MRVITVSLFFFALTLAVTAGQLASLFGRPAVPLAETRTEGAAPVASGPWAGKEAQLLRN